MKRNLFLVLLSLVFLLCACTPAGPGETTPAAGTTSALETTATDSSATVLQPTTVPETTEAGFTLPAEGTPLSDGELDAFQELFRFHNDSSENWYNIALCSQFDCPENVQLNVLFFNGTNGSTKLSDTQSAYLSGIGFPTQMDAHPISVAEADGILEKYFGLTWAETNGVGVDKLYHYPAENCYYSAATGPMLMEGFEFFAGSKLDNGTVKLYYTTNSPDKVFVVTIRGSEESGYRFLSNLPFSEASY